MDYDEPRDRRQAKGIEFHQSFCRFEMISPLSAGGSGNAYKLVWDDETEDYIRSLDTAVVYSVDGHSGPSGTKGRAIYAHEAQRWEVVSVNKIGYSPWMKFQAPSAFTADDDTIAGCEVLATWGDTISGSEVGDTVTVTNELGYAGDETKFGYAQWDDVREIWLVNPYQCPPSEATS